MSHKIGVWMSEDDMKLLETIKSTLQASDYSETIRVALRKYHSSLQADDAKLIRGQHADGVHPNPEDS